MKITLYHGTPSESAESINQSGIINGLVYLTPSKETAAEYASNGGPDYSVFEIDVDYADLCFDSEFCNGDGDLVEESLLNGSAYIDNAVSIRNAVETKYEDFEEIE